VRSVDSAGREGKSRFHRRGHTCICMYGRVDGTDDPSLICLAPLSDTFDCTAFPIIISIYLGPSSQLLEHVSLILDAGRERQVQCPSAFPPSLPPSLPPAFQCLCHLCHPLLVRRISSHPVDASVLSSPSPSLPPSPFLLPAPSLLRPRWWRKLGGRSGWICCKPA